MEAGAPAATSQLEQALFITDNSEDGDVCQALINKNDDVKNYLEEFEFEDDQFFKDLPPLVSDAKQ